MIYVKIKTHQEYKLVTIENFNDERIAIQNNVIANIKTQYLVTLSHELNNPLNSLAHLVNKILSTGEEIKDKNEYKNSIIAIKVNTNLIKFFIKNFIFYIRMSFEMSAIVHPEKIDDNKKKDCVDLKYILNKIKEKYSDVFQTKQVKFEYNFNPIENIFITYDFSYFKSMIKNIFMYLFYRIERKGGVKIEFEFEKELKILFKKVVYRKNQNFADIKLRKQPTKLDTIFVKEFNIESSVKTSKFLSDVIKKFAVMLGVRVTIIEDESPCYLILHLNYDIEENFSQGSQDLAEEFTHRNSKKYNLIQLDKSISVLLDKLPNNNFKGEINKSRNTMSKLNDICFSQPALCGACESANITTKSFVYGSKKTPNGEKKVEANLKEQNNNKLSKSKKKSAKINKNHTFSKHLKKTSTINSSVNSDKDKQVLANKNQKAIVMRSGFSSRYTKYKSYENEIDLIADIVTEKTNQLSNNIPVINTFINNLEENIDEDDILNNLKNLNSGGIININNINTTNNNYLCNTSNIFQSSIFSVTKKASNSSLVKQIIPKINKYSSKMLDSLKNSKNHRKELKTLSFINPISLKLNRSKTLNLPSYRKNIDILIVDDDKFNLNVLQSMLNKVDLSGDTCMNGLECFNKVKSKYDKGIEYKLILMDVMMPVMDGIAASAKIEALVKDNKLNGDISIVIISAHNDQDIINRATKLSVVKEFLSKPVRNADIERIIKQFYYN